MKETPTCKVCKIPLDSENWPTYRERSGQYTCNTCERDRKARWVLANKTHVQECRREWYREHKEEVKARSTQCRRANGVPSMAENKSCPHFQEFMLPNAFCQKCLRMLRGCQPVIQGMILFVAKGLKLMSSLRVFARANYSRFASEEMWFRIIFCALRSITEMI